MRWDSLPQAIVSQHYCVFIGLIVLLWLDEQHLSLVRRVRVRHKQVLAVVLLNFEAFCQLDVT